MKLYDPTYAELRDTAIDIARSPDGDIGELTSLFPESQSVWEVEPLHTLSERQLMDVLNEADRSGELDREREIQDACDKAWQSYKYENLTLNGTSILRLPHMQAAYTSISGNYPNTTEFREIRVVVPPGLQEREARWLIENQIRQQAMEAER